ncbi:DnaA regulatory inactivator Hda [Sulfuriferula plumbiphila]|uniref:DnaA regulatory inactivator Hda n=1 Tax=Sulfuriferula plumbiphila TaxID=171865 RepID=A0A512LBG0_9PROT|nr:DnaA regulatory inactivator Hda [Sulfuriferula plumbiphila]BBP06034.1 DnaA regulatory inactivator Hda [Sulfuriferula plumbiphila]GEP31824.1 DnaA regulatory inactivator Hda [Sulfuriferula plumbiphila]
MKQLVLDIVAPPAPRLANFVIGRNAELLHVLRELAEGKGNERQLYVWGAPGSGKTHLLQAAVATAVERGWAARCVDAAEFMDAMDRAVDFLAIDAAHRLDAAAQIALFNRINALREGHGRLLVAGNAAPAQLELRVDLTTRLGWGLVYQVQALTDAEKNQVLTTYAAGRGFSLQPGVAEYLLRHWRRDLPSLLAALDTLDHYSLETQRPVTVPLLREVLHAE